MTTHIIIPARYGSTRFPGKPLALLSDEPVIVHVVRAALRSRAVRPIYVATDDERIAQAVESRFASHECQVVMTSEACHTGTDRLAEATRAVLMPISERKIIVNVQGDEPFLDPQHIDALISLLENDPQLQMATLATPIQQPEQHDDPNVVKAVISERDKALYFSRAAVPYDRDGNGVTRYRHLGIYGYEANWLLQMAALPPSRLEEIEKLEQLRALENGVDIGIALVENVVPIAIDTPEDLERAQQFLNGVHPSS